MQPENWVVQSAEYGADQNAIVSGPGYFYGICVATDGTNDVDVLIYDALTATGTKLLPALNIPTAATDKHRLIWFDTPIAFNTGISVDIDISAGTCGYMVFYRKK